MTTHDRQSLPSMAELRARRDVLRAVGWAIGAALASAGFELILGWHWASIAAAAVTFWMVLSAERASGRLEVLAEQRQGVSRDPSVTPGGHP
jgi:hypothetical protein